MNTIRITAAMFALLALPFASIADDDGERRHFRHGAAYEHKYREGNCRVERKREKDGEFEEKIECKGGRYGGYARSEFKEEFRDGNCKVKRELDKDGDYKEERKCKGQPYTHARAPAYSMPQEVMVIQPVYVPTPAVVVEPGISIRGTIQVK